LTPRAQLRFLQQQVSGRCTPCAQGSALALALTASDAWDAAQLARLARSLRQGGLVADATGMDSTCVDSMCMGSSCGLRQGVLAPIDCVLRHFPHELNLVPDSGGRVSPA
jgi:NADH:ubiquinone oxidoreductase subunit F (NADH-binding)